MRYIYFTILFFVATSLMAQNTFELTPEGFKTNKESFIVVEFPEKTANELFTSAKLYLTSFYKSSKDVISQVEDKMITLNGFQPKYVRRNSMHVFDIDYNFTIQFKDGKIRFDAPTFELTTYSNHKQKLHLVWGKLSLDGSNLGIYGKKNKLKSKKAKEDLEMFFNKIIEGIIASCNKEATDEW